MDQMKTMIVDDESIVLEMGARLLESQGMAAAAFANPDIALEWYLANVDAVNCAILDLVMPGLGGTGLFAKLRERSPQLPIVIVSGYSSDEEVERLLLEPKTYFVQKPFERSVFVSVIRKAVAG